MLTIPTWGAVLALIGTIVVGALGSGLWEILFKRWYGVSIRAAQRIFTFGLSVLRDTIYLEAAKNQNDRASLWLVYAALLFGSFYVLNSIDQARQYPSRSQFARTFQKLKIDRLLKSDNFKKLSLEDRTKVQDTFSAIQKLDQEDDEISWLEKKRRYEFTIDHYQGHWIPQVSMVIICSMCIVRGVRLKLISTAVSEFRQAFQICRPYLQEADQWKVASEFASVRGRDDYQLIMNHLKDIANSNKIWIPSFTLS